MVEGGVLFGTCCDFVEVGVKGRIQSLVSHFLT